MGLITLNLKRVLNWNFIFMSAVAAIFGMISLMNFGDISENIVFGVDIKYFMLDGYLCLFIFFAGEISKDMLQQEKITKRIEWKLANGIKISSIVKENLLSLWIGTLILLFPLLLMISIRLPNLILLLGTYFLILSILYSAFINVLILWIRNMNWFKSIPIFATLLHILLVFLKCGIFMKTNNVWMLLLFSPVSIIVLTACGLLLFDDHRIFGESLSKLLEDWDAISICHYVSNETEFWNILSVDEWDIVLLDVNLRDQSKNSGIDLIEKIYNKKPKTKVAMLSSYDMPVYRQEALKRGAVSYIDKSASADELVKKLTAISKGHKSTTPPLLDPLTDREAEIIKAIGTGKTKHEIAQELYISERTLYNHIQSIYDKLGAKNAIEAYNKAIALGYITPLI